MLLDQDHTVSATASDLSVDREALIHEARRRTRRRRTGIALTVFVAAATGLLVLHAGGGSRRPRQPASILTGASGAAVQSFLTRAGGGLSKSFIAIYTVDAVSSVNQPRTGRHQVTIIAAQSPGRLMYSEPVTRGRWEVFASPYNDPQGLYSCGRLTSTGGWSCVGPYKGIGMSDSYALTGPYPPQALMVGLRNATAQPNLSGITPSEYLSNREIRGQREQCLTFVTRTGRTNSSVCLNGVGLIAYYKLSRSLTGNTGIYSYATLDAYRSGAPRGSFTLPGPPSPNRF